MWTLGRRRPHTHLSDAAVGQLGAGGEVQLLQPAEGQERGPGVVPELVQVVLRHHLGPLFEGQTRRLEEAHDAEGAREPRPLVPLLNTAEMMLTLAVSNPPSPPSEPHHLLLCLVLAGLCHAQQPAVGDLFAPGEPQDHEPPKVSGDGARRQVGQVGAGRQVQLAEGLPEVPREGKHGEILKRRQGAGGHLLSGTRPPQKKTRTHPDVDAAFEVEGVQLCPGGGAAV